MKFFRCVLLICIGLICFSPQSFSISKQLPNIKSLQQEASQNNIQAQITLGNMYETGQNIPKDYKKALEWYTKAANQGNALAQFYVGRRYADGALNIPKDYKKALEWYTKAANQGNAQAQLNIGIMYQDGLGVPKDVRKSLEWYTKAANQGNALAQLNIGIIYKDGLGVPKDYKKAKIYFKQSCLNKLQISCDL